jgi:hypothetical protein
MIKLNINEFLAMTTLLAGAGLAAPGCVDNRGANRNDPGGSGGDGGSAGFGGSGGGFTGTGASTFGGSGGDGGDAGLGDAGDAGGSGGASTGLDGGVDASGDAGPGICLGDESTLGSPDGGGEGASPCDVLWGGYCEATNSNRVADYCALGEVILRAGVFESLFDCLMPFGGGSKEDAADAAAGSCDPALDDAAAACWIAAVEAACPEATEQPVEAGALHLDCDAVTSECAGVSMGECQLATGALNDEGRALQQACYDAHKLDQACDDAFSTCLLDPFAD